MICKIDIMAKPRMTRRDKWPPPRKCVAKYWKFKDELVACAKKEGFKLGNCIYMEFHIPMAKSWSKKKKALMLGKPHQQKSDLDNLEKSVLDSLLPEDCTVWHIEAKKFWSEEPMLILENIYEW